MPMIFCPTCDSMLEIDSGSIGSMVECGSCKAQFTAKVPKESKPASETHEDQWQSGQDSNYDDRPRRPTRRQRDDDDDPLDESFRRPPDGGNGFGIASLILGIVGLLSACCCAVFAICDILAIIFGILSLKTPGRGMGTAGMILGIIGLLLHAGLLVLGVGLNVAQIAAGRGGR